MVGVFFGARGVKFFSEKEIEMSPVKPKKLEKLPVPDQKPRINQQ